MKANSAIIARHIFWEISQEQVEDYLMALELTEAQLIEVIQELLKWMVE